MIKACFNIFNGISNSGERNLWDHGILTWQYFEKCFNIPLNKSKVDSIRGQIKEGIIALEYCVVDWFLARLKGVDKLRVIHDFNPIYLDIETTGLTKRDSITLITTHDGYETNTYIRGQNLFLFLSEIPKIKILITYNGAKFDLPFIRREFGISLSVPHIDLMEIMHSCGMYGGQKICEKILGIYRNKDQSITGKDAVLLWEKYKRGSENSLKQLLDYNIRDTTAMKELAHWAYQKSMEFYPINIKYC